MLEYDLPIAVKNGKCVWPGRLKVVRLPNRWYAAVWVSPKLYASFDQTAMSPKKSFRNMSDKDFLDRVQLVAHWVNGIEFEFEGGI